MPETIKMVKFKTNVSFVGSDGVFYAGGSVVQLFQEDFDGQVDVCTEFGLPVPELIEEVEAVVEDSTLEPEQTPTKARGKKAAVEKPEGETEDGETKDEANEL
jgi:hypothetical protein